MNPSTLYAYIKAATDLFARPNDPVRLDAWAERLGLHLKDLERINTLACSPTAHPIMPGVPLAPTAAATEPNDARPDPAWAERVANAFTPSPSQAQTCAQRVRQAFSLIEEHDALNAFETTRHARALERAAQLDAQHQPDSQLPLKGATLAVKSCFQVQGLPMTGGSPALDPITPTQSAPCVARLEQAGAIVLGTTTMHELAYGATTDNPWWGRTGHPADPTCIAGGSSGGSAVAVATGMADMALGTDTAGSVRMPAALCGIVGFKPSFGLIPTTGVLPLGWSLDHVGVMAKTVEQVALLTDIMSGQNRIRSASGPMPTPQQLTLVCPQNYFFDAIEPSVKQAFEAALATLQHHGATVQRVTIPELDIAPTLQFMTLCAEASQLHQDLALLRPQSIGDEVRTRLEIGRFIRAVDYLKAQRLRQQLLVALSQHLGPNTVLATPTVPTGACPVQTHLTLGGVRLPIHPALTRCTLPFNLTGMPAVSVPCGEDKNGFPVGLQLAGVVGGDAGVLRVAGVVEGCLG
ncbi:amidase [Nitratireductor alexandrii]|uniref:amidase n=1 Tax=Nitratireductor alexandrii TaxID=2448161 RepID=UPI000FD700DD|nr:amidase [Nitratireductor alexandrii]MCB1714343.1 amidase [Candidatus Competibacteraceae bacterium]MCB1987378.1 amidase [Burkholderiaceae bacterium]